MTIEDFMDACKHGNLANVKALVSIVNNDTQSRGLMWAIIGNHLSVFNFLLSQPYLDINMANSISGATAAHVAALFNNEDMLRVLVNKEEIDLDLRDKKGRTAKMYATVKSFTDCVSIIEEAENLRKAFTAPTKEESLLLLATGVSAMKDEFTDLYLICQGQEFRCNKVIVSARSSVLMTALTNPMFLESTNNRIVIEDSTPEAVQAMLDHIYTGDVPNNIDHLVVDILHISDKYDVTSLKKICEKTLLDNLNAQNAINTLILADRYKTTLILRLKALRCFKENVAEIIKTSDWKDAMRSYPDLITELVAFSHSVPKC